MSTNKTCTNCPGATDHDTAHCPLRPVIHLGDLNPEQRLALARGQHPGQAEGRQEELGDLLIKAAETLVSLELQIDSEWGTGGWNEEKLRQQGAEGILLADRLRSTCAALAQPSPDVPYADGITADLERSDWTPEEALRWYAKGNHFDVVGGRTRIIDTGAVASNALKHLSLPYLEMKGDAELTELREATAQPSPAPELELERPRIMGYATETDGLWGLSVGRRTESSEPLMAVAQHDRMALERWRYFRRKMRQMRDLMRGMRDQLNAAKARVAELEAQHGGVCLWRQNDSHWFSIECGGSWTREDSRDGVPSCCINCGKETHVLSPFHDGKEWQKAPTFEEGRAKLPKPAAPIAQAGQVLEQVTFSWPEYSSVAMGCGLEDRSITDRYEAMQYGWDCAIESCAELIEGCYPLYAVPAKAGDA